MDGLPAAAPIIRAADSYRNQARFRAVCQSIVSQVLRENEGRLRRLEKDPHDVRRVADEIAISTAGLVLQTVYENDAELRHWKALAEKLSEMPLVVSRLSPMPITLIRQTEPHAAPTAR